MSSGIFIEGGGWGASQETETTGLAPTPGSPLSRQACGQHSLTAPSPPIAGCSLPGDDVPERGGGGGCSLGRKRRGRTNKERSVVDSGFPT